MSNTEQSRVAATDGSPVREGGGEINVAEHTLLPQAGAQQSVALHEHLLHNLQSADRAPRCLHAHTSGRRCGSPAANGSQYCFFHRNARRPNPKRIMMPFIEEAVQIQAAISQALNDFVRGRLNRKDLFVYLQALHLAHANLRSVKDELATAQREGLAEQDAMDRLAQDHAYKQFAAEGNDADRKLYNTIRQSDDRDYAQRELTEADWDELYPIMRRMGDHTGDQLEQPQPEYQDVETQHAAPPARAADASREPAAATKDSDSSQPSTHVLGYESSVSNATQSESVTSVSSVASSQGF